MAEWLMAVIIVCAPGHTIAQIFVANTYNDTIGEYGLDGSTVNAALITGRPYDPLSLAISGGNLLVANYLYQNNTVSEYTLSGNNYDDNEYCS